MIPFPVSRDIEALSEWVEAEAFFGDIGSVSRNDVMDALRDEPLEDEGENREAYETELERLCDDVWSHLEARARVSGRRYPLKIHVSLAQRASRWQEDPWIGLLFLLSLRGWYKLTVPIQRAARLFELLVTCALGNFMGGPAMGGEARRFGWPVDADEVDFEARVRAICHAINARFGGLTGVSRNVKDHELDVVAWRRFPDQRTGVWVILCQCGIGQDWARKTLNVQQWGYVMQMIPQAMTALAIPFVPEHDDERRGHWDNVGTKGALAFDRLRLTHYLEPACAQLEESSEELAGWIKDIVSNLKTAIPRGQPDETEEE